VDYGVELVLKAHDKEVERTAWELWLTLDGETKKENPFNEYLQKVKQPSIQNKDSRSEEDVLKDAENILKSMKRSE
jgi:hypothetical protein